MESQVLFCLQIFKITLWKPGDAKEKAKALFKSLEATDQISTNPQISSVWAVSPEVCLRAGLPAHHNPDWEWW